MRCRFRRLERGLRSGTGRSSRRSGSRPRRTCGKREGGRSISNDGNTGRQQKHHGDIVEILKMAMMSKITMMTNVNDDSDSDHDVMNVGMTMAMTVMARTLIKMTMRVTMVLGMLMNMRVMMTLRVSMVMNANGTDDNNGDRHVVKDDNDSDGDLKNVDDDDDDGNGSDDDADAPVDDVLDDVDEPVPHLLRARVQPEVLVVDVAVLAQGVADVVGRQGAVAGRGGASVGAQ